jgi:hypothetical protein
MVKMLDWIRFGAGWVLMAVFVAGAYTWAFLTWTEGEEW